ncbi:hypothetical protein HPB51_002406 [Rhipicephalus microplus]|uniref:BACK domain-containing protein n=1 Tax=Rhipicephalus microplus TaxID=6941 RepID=A0A9J6DT18_RHIMP|nr:hypothetical protein HPB51_002406 [Rhipicephalus microplus]
MQLELQGVSADAFRALLDYMYSGKLQLTCQNIGKLYVTASILKIARVKKKCARILTKSPYDPKHAVYVYVTARKYGLTTVCKRALKLLHHRLEETVTCKPYLDLDVNQVCEVLSGNTVGARGEMVIFLAALHWLNHNYLQNEPYVLKVMQCVRFGTMSIEELLCCLHPPLLPGIMEVHEVRAHILAALCYKVAAMYNQQHLFPAPQLNARYFKLDGPITLWDLNLFSTDKNLPAAAPAPGCPRYLNDASANILRRALPLATQLPAQREPVFHSDPLADYLLRNQAEIPLSAWNDDPYAGLGTHASGARDPLSPVLLVVGGFDPDAPGDTAVVVDGDSRSLKSSHPFSLELRSGRRVQPPAMTAQENSGPSNVAVLLQPPPPTLPNNIRLRDPLVLSGLRGDDVEDWIKNYDLVSDLNRILSSVEALCLDERRQWQEMPCRLCRPRMAAGSTQMGGRLWLAGGLTDSRAGLVVISDVDCFDPGSCERPRVYGGRPVFGHEVRHPRRVLLPLHAQRLHAQPGPSTAGALRASVVVLPPMEMEVAANCAGLDGNRWTGNSRIGSDVVGEPLANIGKCVRTDPVTDSGRSPSAGSPSSCRTQIRPRSNQGNPWHTWHRSNNDRPPSYEPTGAVIATAALQPERVQQPQQPPPRCAHSEYRAEANK